MNQLRSHRRISDIDQFRNRTAGKTAQFWMIYLDLMEAQVMAWRTTEFNKTILI